MVFGIEQNTKLGRKMDNSVKNNSDYETSGENNDQLFNLWIPLLSRLDVSAYSFIGNNCIRLYPKGLLIIKN